MLNEPIEDKYATLRPGTVCRKLGYYVLTGGGVAAGSVPSLEYEETRNKAGAMVRALEVARSRGT